MTTDFKYTLCIKKTYNDYDLDSYLPMIDYEVCREATEWCKLNAPTAKIYRNIESLDTYMYITWDIIFQSRDELVLYVLTR